MSELTATIQLVQVNVAKHYYDFHAAKVASVILDPKRIEINVGFEVRALLDDKLLQLPLFVSCKDSHTDTKVFEIVTESAYQLTTFEQIIQDNEYVKQLTEIVPILLSVAYSTTRGLAIAYTQGPAFPGILLPIIDPDHLTKNLQFSIRKFHKTNGDMYSEIVASDQ